MIVFESRESRRVIGRLERGERVARALHTLAQEQRITTGWLRGIGSLEWAEIRGYDADSKRYGDPERLDGPVEIVGFEGNFSFQEGNVFTFVKVTLAVPGPGGLSLRAGELLDASVFSLELLVDCLDDLGLGRERDAATGLALWRGMSRDAVDVEEDRPTPLPKAPAMPSEDASSAGVSWAQVAAVSEEAEKPAAPPRPPPAERASRSSRKGRRRPPAAGPLPPAFVPDPIPAKRRTTEEEFFDEPIPEKGDWVDHKVFGLCRVDGEDAEGALLIRLPSGVRKTIKLDFLRVEPARFDGERRIYPIRPKRR